MNTAEISAIAHRLFQMQGSKAIAEVAQKAISFENAGDKEQAIFWRRVENVMLEIRGPSQS